MGISILVRGGGGDPARTIGSHRIGWKIDPPEQVRGDNGEPTGIAVELVREAARRRGIRLEWVYRQDSSAAALRGGYVYLWPIMTITPERARVLDISPSLRETTHCLLVRSDSPAGRLAVILPEAGSGHSGVPLNRLLLTGYLPKAQLVIGPPNELIKGACARDIDAAFIEEHAAIAALLAGGRLSGASVESHSRQWSRCLQLGVGSTFQAAAAANAIQEEIGRMAAEGLLAPLLAKWGYLTGSQPGIQFTLC